MSHLEGNGPILPLGQKGTHEPARKKMDLYARPFSVEGGKNPPNILPSGIEPVRVQVFEHHPT
jgi:hypothetical protein